MVKHTQTILRQQPTNCLSVFDHFVGLAFIGLKDFHDQRFTSSFGCIAGDTKTVAKTSEENVTLEKIS